MFGVLEIVNLVFLGYASYFDVYRNKQINDSLFVIWILGSICYSIYYWIAYTIFWNSVFAIGTFVMLYAVSRISNGKFGMADVFGISIIAFTTPHLTGLWLAISAGLIGLFALVNAMHTLAETKSKLSWGNLKAEINRPYPFFPFLLLGYIVVLVL